MRVEPPACSLPTSSPFKRWEQWELGVSVVLVMVVGGARGAWRQGVHHPRTRAACLRAACDLPASNGSNGRMRVGEEIG